MHLLVTRPEPEASAMAARLAALGVSATLAPLLVVEACPPDSLTMTDPGGAVPARLGDERPAAVVATSRNALAAIAGHAGLDALRRLPLIVVGPGTARAARAMSFGDVVEGSGAASDIPAAIAARGFGGPLLILRGETVAFDLAGALSRQGVEAREVVVYRTIAPRTLPAAARDALAAGLLDGVVLMSPKTAKVFTMLVQGADLTSALSRLTYFCLSPAVALAASAPAAADIVIAEKPNLEEMLALIARRASQSSAKI